MSVTANIPVQQLTAALWKNIRADVLRLDQLHPVVSGNKWFKLRQYLSKAANEGKNTIATFGGAYSNHIVATAFAGQAAGLHTIGFIRGEKTTPLSPTLAEAAGYGMELVYVSREQYRNKPMIKDAHANPSWLWINEGGYGPEGMMGAQDILSVTDTSHYTHILCACGTGTTLAGLALAALPHQQCIGISALKGHTGLLNDVMELVPPGHLHKEIEVLHQYHFGGYAKHPPHLIEWMNTLWREEQLPTDMVYTSKLLFAVKDMIDNNYFSTQHQLLIIHSGGLQGNRSLPNGTLEFL